MKQFASLFLLLILSSCGLFAQVDSSFAEIELMGVDSKLVKVADFSEQQAVVVIFTGIHCVYAKKYEQRILNIVNDYQDKPIAFLLVNSNDPQLSPENGYGKMVARASENSYSCPYLSDPEQTLSTALGVKKIPEAVVLKPSEEGFSLIYRGAIDNNPLMGDRATLHYLLDALGHVLDGHSEPIPFQPTKGCNIKAMDW